MPVIELSMTGRPKSGRVVGIDLGTTNSLVATPHLKVRGSSATSAVRP